MKAKVKILITVVGLIIGGISDWFQPHNQGAVLGISIWLILSLSSFLGALLLMVFLNQKPTVIPLLLSLGVTIAVLARIIYDTTFWDSTSHNLAPFEIIMFLLIAVPSAFAGSFLAVLIKKFFK